MLDNTSRCHVPSLDLTVVEILFNWVMELVDDRVVESIDAYAAMKLMLSFMDVKRKYLQLYMCACIRVITAYRCNDSIDILLIVKDLYSNDEFIDATLDVIMLSESIRDSEDIFEMMCRDNENMSDNLYAERNRQHLTEAVRLWTQTGIMTVPQHIQ